MAVKTWTLTDSAADSYVNRLAIGPADVGGNAQFAVNKHTLRGGLRDGVDVIHVDNGQFSFVVVPTRGMGIWRAWLGDWPIGWNSPVRGPVHPKFVPLTEPSGLGWLDGFDELLVRCGLESNGAPDFDATGQLKYPLHGRIANRPAQQVEVAVDDEMGQISVTGVVEETRFHFTKLRLTSTVTTMPGQAGFRIRDQIESFSGSPADAQMLYHVNFGPPLLTPGAELVAPVRKLVPRNDRAAADVGGWQTYGPEQPGAEEQVYFFQLLADADDRTHVLLKNSDATRGVSLRYDTRTLPYFIQWKNTTATSDGYVTGLEPATNFPNPRTFETGQQRIVTLPPGGNVVFDLELEVQGDAVSVNEAQRQIAQIQSQAAPEIIPAPRADWCAT